MHVISSSIPSRYSVLVTDWEFGSTSFLIVATSQLMASLLNPLGNRVPPSPSSSAAPHM